MRGNNECSGKVSWKSFLSIVSAIFCTIFYSCSCQVDESVLEQAGENRTELEKVIDYFRTEGSSLEFASAVFLINNMPYHAQITGELVDFYDAGYESMAKQPIARRDVFYRDLNKRFGREGLAYDKDIRLIKSNYLIPAIRQACNTWEMTGWNDLYSNELFFRYVLPYKIADEPLSEWRKSVGKAFPGMGKDEVRSRRGLMMEAETGETNSEILGIVGASGKSVRLQHAGDSILFTISMDRDCRQSLWLRYSCPTMSPEILVTANNRLIGIVELVPSNDENTFIFSQNVIDVDLKEGVNRIVLRHSHQPVNVDYLILKSVESQPEAGLAEFAFGSTVVNRATEQAITFSPLQHKESSSVLEMADYDGQNTWQSLDICMRGYGSYTISPVAATHRDSLCMEAQYSRYDIGTRVSQYRFIASPHQLWTIIPVNGGGYRIMGRDSGLYLEARRDKDGEKRLFLQPFSHSDAQIWDIFEPNAPKSVLYSPAIREAMKVYDYMYVWKWCACNAFVAPTASTLMRSKTGNCHEEACFVVNLCRYLGIPAAIDFTPHWGNRSQAHEWSVLIDTDGKGVPFYMGRIPGDTTNAFNGYKKPKVLRNCFSVDRQADAIIKQSALPEPWLMFPCYEDVTSEYGPVSDVERAVPADFQNRGVAYICVFDNRQWVPVYWGEIAKGKVVFKNMARDIMYMAAVVNEEGRIQPFGNPFSIDPSGTIHEVEANLQNPQPMTLLRKFPFLGKQDPFNTRMSRGRFQASHASDFQNAADLYYFTGITNGNWYDVAVENDRVYEYVRYIGPSGSYCNINEMQFFDKEGQLLKGTVIGTQGKSGHEKETVFDGNILTGFEGISPDGHWVGLKLSEPSQIGKIRFIGRNDGNTIEIGDNYELFYWNEGTWHSVGVRSAADNRLDYDSIPSNGLYVLKDRTKGWEERIFTFENGEQRWW